MNTKEKVITVLTNLSGVTGITEKDSLTATLALDSLSLALMILELEDSLNVQFKEADMNPFDLINVWHVVNLVEKYAGGENNEENEKED